MILKHFITSESVTEGHPDKVCDQISDAILDSIIAKDPLGRVAVEALATNGLVVVAGEVTTNCYIEIPQIVRNTIKEIGYTDPSFGFDYQNCGVMVSIKEQSKDIARGVDSIKKNKSGKIIKEDLRHLGAGDQGLMYGYATNETKDYMPLPISLAHKLSQKLAQVRKSNKLTYLRPDGKSQVSVEYHGSKPVRVDNVVISTQHSPSISLSKLKKDIIKNVIKPTIPASLMDKNTKFYINPTGRFVIGGPQGDTGLTGRKIIIDTYGGVGRHGGGCFSGKDPTKVDRSGSYAARYVAKNIVAAGLCDRCEVQVAYAIGVAHPLSINIDTFGTEKIAESKIVEIIKNTFDLRPGIIIQELNLRQPIYRAVASYGHFGRSELNLPWERTDKVKKIKAQL